MSDKHWKDWFFKQSVGERDKMAIAAIERLIEIEEVSFRIDDNINTEGEEVDEDYVIQECLFWDSCGEDIRDS